MLGKTADQGPHTNFTSHSLTFPPPIDLQPSLRSCPLPIIPLSLTREEGMIHFFVGSHVKRPESGLFSDWIGNNTDDLRCSDWPSVSCC